VKIDKFKRRATIHGPDGWTLDAHFFLRMFAQDHSGREILLDILNSRITLIPVEDIQADEILLINKNRVMYLQLPERDLIEETLLSPEVPVQIDLIDGGILTGSFLLEMPPERSRLSDFINFSPPFVYLCREEGDLIVNKAYVLSVRDKTKSIE